MDEKQILQLLDKLKSLSNQKRSEVMKSKGTIDLPEELKLLAKSDINDDKEAGVESPLSYFALAKMINFGLQAGDLPADPVWLKLQLGLIDRGVTLAFASNKPKYLDVAKASPDIDKAITEATNNHNSRVDTMLKLGSKWGKARIGTVTPQETATALAGLLAVYTQKAIDGFDSLLDSPNMLLSCLTLASQLAETPVTSVHIARATDTRH